jgi:tryptophanase
MDAYKTKVATRVELPDRAERESILRAAGYNVFDVDASDVYVDLLTDSGTGAMSDHQWAALMRGDEAYAGSDSFHELRAAVEEVMGFSRIVPAHQGRGAENVLYGALLSAGDVVINNTHFDTTRAHVANQGAEPLDCPSDEAWEMDSTAPFKGNLSLERAREAADRVGADRVPAVVVTVTNNSAAGQPVSVENVRRAREFADEVDAVLVLDACRFAENAAFVQRREPEFEGTPIPEIAREQLSYADALVMSGKKDGLANAGGFVAVADDPELDDLFEHCKQRGILYEGFPTYGGMAGRDMAAMAVGLHEAVEAAYVADRIAGVRELAGSLSDAGIPVYDPPGGHAVYVDAGELLPSIPDEEFPGQALVCELYREGAVRAVELGSLAFPDTDRPELVRLAVPRRTYHREHRDHVVETFEAVADRSEAISGYRITSDPSMPELRHFTADLEPIGG